MVAYKEYKYTSFEEMVTFAETTLGYLEKATGSVLGDFTPEGKVVNAGYNNYTVYWDWYKTLTKQNWQGQPYCAGYVSTIFSSAFGYDKAVGLLCGELYISCQTGFNNFKKKKRIYSTPKVGDIVFFWSNDLNRYGHTAFVVGVDANGKGYTTMEANTSSGNDVVVRNGGATCRKHYSSIGARKEKFGRPDYEAYGISIEAKPKDMVTYAIGTGASGLCVTASALNYRTTPGSTAANTVKGNLKQGTAIYPTLKTFVNGDPWVYDEKYGWFSAKYFKGWMQEFTCDNKWWYVEEGYTYATSTVKVIDGRPYYFDASGYMFVGTITLTTNEDGVLITSKNEGPGDVNE